MKRTFMRVGISLIGMVAWLLPNQAMAYNCSVTVNGYTITWSCPSADMCFWTITYNSDGTYYVSVSCT